jgi:hypothetical protein
MESVPGSLGERGTSRCAGTGVRPRWATDHCDGPGWGGAVQCRSAVREGSAGGECRRRTRKAGQCCNLQCERQCRAVQECSRTVLPSGPLALRQALPAPLDQTCTNGHHERNKRRGQNLGAKRKQWRGLSQTSLGVVEQDLDPLRGGARLQNDSRSGGIGQRHGDRGNAF